MATSYTPLLGLALPAVGELVDTWGDVVNASVTRLVEAAVAGMASADVTAGDWTLDDTGGGAANEARCAVLVATGTPISGKAIIAPARSKVYIVINKTAQIVTLKASGTTGVGVSPGQCSVLVWDGVDFTTPSEGSRYKDIDQNADLHTLTESGWYSWDAVNIPGNTPTNKSGFAFVKVLDVNNIRIDVYEQGTDMTWTSYLSGGSWTPWVPRLSAGAFATDNEAKAASATDKIISPHALGVYFADKTVANPTDKTPGKLLDLGAFGIGVPISLGNDDLNDITTGGFYYQDNPTYATQPNHYPLAIAGVLWVSELGASGTTQMYISQNDATSYTRSKGQSGWTGWNSFVSMPVGATYMQFPGQTKPEDIWGGTWVKLFDTESVFFRTEGAASAAFGGGIQAAAFESHTHTGSTNSAGSHTHTGSTSSAGSHSHNFYSGYDEDPGSNNVYSSLNGSWDGWRSTESAGAHSHSMYLDNAGSHSHTITMNNTGGTETRPKNITVRIWLRTA